MQSHRWVLLAISAATLTASVALADGSPTTPGTLEISTSVAFNRSTFSPDGSDLSVSSTHLSAAAGVGRSMTQNLALDGSFLFQHRALAGEGRNGVGAVLGGTYNFAAQGTLYPFISAGFGAINYFDNGQSDKALLLPRVRFGFRSMIGGQRSLNVSLGYQHETNSESTVPGSENMFDVGIGVSLFHAR